MFKNEIKFITDFNTAKLKNYSGLLSLKDIKKSNLHFAVLKYILAEIEQQLFLDRQKLIKNSIFEYDDERINNYLNLISENVKRTNKFKFEYLSKLVQDSVTFNIHFLISPNKTLTQFVFGNTNKKTSKEITLALSHIYYYKYFRKIILAYLEKKNINSISRKEFITLLKKIDHISKKSHLNDTINTAINSMADFFKIAVSNKIPIQAIYLFLQGKKLTNHTKIIQSEFLDKSILVATATEIKNTLGSVALEEDILDETKNEQENLTLIEETTQQSDNKINETPDNLLDIVENDHIPNEELLSSESNIVNEAEENSLTKEIQSAPKETNNISKSEEKIVENDITSEATNEIKPDAKAAISSLINIDNLYDSILKGYKPFDTEEIKITDPNTFLKDIEDKIDFKIEKSNLEESLIPEDLSLENDSELNQFQSVYEGDLELNQPTKEKEDIFIEENDETILHLKETEEKIKEIEEYINESKIEPTLDYTNKETEINVKPESSNISNETSSDIPNEDITLSENNDEEITEVFSDLTYLDKKEIDEEEHFEELQEEKTITEDEFEEITIEDENLISDSNENDILTKTDVISDTKTLTSFKTFKEMVANRDMSQTIEIIFDYDMEDYQRILNNISQSSTENEALKIVDEYCNQNYINTTFTEVKKFKSLISNYFKQHQK